MSDKKFLICDILNEADERISDKELTFHDIDVALMKLNLQYQPYFNDIEKEAVILYLERQVTNIQLMENQVQNRYLKVKLEATDKQLQINRDLVQFKLDKILDLLSPDNGNEN